MIKKQNKKKKLSIKAVNRILFLLIIVGCVYYLAGSNDLSTKGFRILELKKEANYLKNENNRLEIKIMSLESYNSLNERVKSLSMVPVGEIDYLSSRGEAVAKK